MAGGQAHATYDVLRIPAVRQVAVTGNSVSRAAADSLATQRLGADPSGDSGEPAGARGSAGSDAGQDAV